ncbi:MAG: SGNH/GDSL hydrolase family protein [bacterium]|nr:SGNH/GDSL hydrolase family protein [bacterium]
MSDQVTRRQALGTMAAAGVIGSQLHAGAEETQTMSAEAELAKIQPLLKGNQAVTWVFAGDSITHGARHLYGNQDYVQLFAERLRWELGQERNIVIKTATSGWTIPRIAADIDWRILQFNPKVVSIHIGMNDCSAGDGGLVSFRDTYLAVIAKVREKTGAAIILHTPNAIIPGGNPGREPHLPKYVDAARAVAAETGAILVDHYANWLEYMENSQIHYLMNDALHPDLYGHRFKALALFRALGIYDPESPVCRLMVPR